MAALSSCFPTMIGDKLKGYSLQRDRRQSRRGLPKSCRQAHRSLIADFYKDCGEHTSTEKPLHTLCTPQHPLCTPHAHTFVKGVRLLAHPCTSLTNLKHPLYQIRYPGEREVQRRCSLAENLLRGLSDQEDETIRVRSRSTT